MDRPFLLDETQAILFQVTLTLTCPVILRHNVLPLSTMNASIDLIVQGVVMDDSCEKGGRSHFSRTKAARRAIEAGNRAVHASKEYYAAFRRVVAYYVGLYTPPPVAHQQQPLPTAIVAVGRFPALCGGVFAFLFSKLYALLFLPVRREYANLRGAVMGLYDLFRREGAPAVPSVTAVGDMQLLSNMMTSAASTVLVGFETLLTIQAPERIPLTGPTVWDDIKRATDQRSTLVYDNGAPQKNILFLGSCRMAAHLFYFHSHPKFRQKYNFHLILVYMDFIRDMKDGGVVNDPAICSILQNTEILIAEHVVNYGYFNTRVSCEKNVFRLGLAPRQVIILPNLSVPTSFIALARDSEVYHCFCEYRRGGEGERDIRNLKRVCEETLESRMKKLDTICTKSGFPELSAVYRESLHRRRTHHTIDHPTNFIFYELYRLVLQKYFPEAFSALSLSATALPPHNEFCDCDAIPLSIFDQLLFQAEVRGEASHCRILDEDETHEVLESSHSKEPEGNGFDWALIQRLFVSTSTRTT
jgi:hypothetical protein